MPYAKELILAEEEDRIPERSDQFDLYCSSRQPLGLGQKGQLLVTIPQDQKRFRDMTLGKVIVMGRKTLDTLPGGQPLYGRRNVILSRDPEYRVKGADVCHSVEECLELLKNYGPDDIYIIGGESIYRQFLPYCSRAEIYLD